MSTSVEAFCTSAPALMKTLQKAFTAHRQKGYIFLRGVEGSTRLPFLFSDAAEPNTNVHLQLSEGCGGSRRMEPRSSLFPESEVGGFNNWLHVCTLRPGEKGRGIRENAV